MSATPDATILIAEDDPASRKLLSTCLKQAGFQTIETSSGDEAVRLAKDKQPDLAILDIMLPGMDGTDAAAVISNETDVPFIFLSALDEEKVVDKAIKAGALGYLVKPFNVPQLAPTVRAALERATEMRRLRESESNLSAALAVGRETSMAVGILMERHRMNQEAAFEALRLRARSSRRKIAELAEDIIKATETLNTLDSGKPRD